MQVVDAIPVDRPFVVRARYGTQTVVLGGVILLAVVGSVALIAFALALEIPLAPVLAVLACAAALPVLLLGLQIRRLTGSNVLLAAGPSGLWIRSEAPLVDNLHLQWEEVERVSIVHRRLLDKRLVVTPRDPRFGGGRGGPAGVGFHVRISLADRSSADIVAALRHYRAGQCER